jgi:DNA-binding MarR family transcriptional regulator
MPTAPAAPTTHWLTTEQQSVWRHYLLGSARLTDRLDADLRRFGLDLAEYEILVTLSEAPERRVRMSDLALAVHQSRSRLTHTITRMEAARLVERTSCPSDKRGVWAQLSDQGFELLTTAAAEHVASVRRYFVDVMSAEDYAALGRGFAAIARATAE